ncbi:MAG: hypothetical protein QOF62_416, partial [Pyrinomonadaceae bacterium]|nr:hypothetical protein [Pyrinomonadaceae bacterium]
MSSRQRNAKSRAPARRAFHADVARMLLNDPVRHRETEASAGANSLGRVKRIVNLGDILGRYAQTRIGDLNDQRMIVRRNRRNPDR